MRRAVRAIVFRDNDLLVMKRDKFGEVYYTLPGGGVNIGEADEAALQREMQEETGLQLGATRLVFVEDAGPMYGVQYIYLVDYVGGEPHLANDSIEAQLDAEGKNRYDIEWLPTSTLTNTVLRPETLKQALLSALTTSFPDKPINI